MTDLGFKRQSIVNQVVKTKNVYKFIKQKYNITIKFTVSNR